MTVTAPTVYLVDDDKMVRKALVRLLSAAGYRAESYASAKGFLDHHDSSVHGCAVLDLRLEGMDGFAIQEHLLSGPTVRPIVFLTGHGDIPSSVRAIKGGAVDFLTKPVEVKSLLSAVEAALERDLATRGETKDRDKTSARLASLTPRESEVLTHVVAGRRNKQIAADLGVAEKTIKVHRGRMMKKMGAQTVADLVRVVTLHTDQGGAL